MILQALGESQCAVTTPRYGYFVCTLHITAIYTFFMTKTHGIDATRKLLGHDIRLVRQANDAMPTLITPQKLYNHSRR